MKHTLALALVLAAVAANASPMKVTGLNLSAGTSKDERTLNGATITGSTSSFNTSNLGLFHDGSLNVSGHTYGYTQQMGMDLGPGNTYKFNPDRVTNGTHFTNEAAKTASLSEVFTYKKLGRIMDGEDNTPWTMDLNFGNGQYVVNDGKATTAELMVLERGRNSTVGVRAILANGAVSNDLLLDFHTATAVADTNAHSNYMVQTMEISSPQTVGGYGVSLDSFGLATGTKVYGYEFFASNASKYSSVNWGGPDITGVASVAATPEPATMSLIGIGALAAIRRRRAK